MYRATHINNTVYQSLHLATWSEIHNRAKRQRNKVSIRHTISFHSPSMTHRILPDVYLLYKPNPTPNTPNPQATPLPFPNHFPSLQLAAHPP